ncbi:Phosphatidate phosphatase PAH1-like protein [Drosera capensis]
MNVVGRVGSLISQGVYSVATPFHPFGGAVDIIAVQQQDGSFRSTPWYVRFGKFQGVLKGAEKIVKINVNGVEANFHMYLDNSGEAYFVREADSGQDTETNGLIKDGREGTHDDSDVTSVNNDNAGKGFSENLRLHSTMSDPGAAIEEYSSLIPNRLERAESDACQFYDFQDDPPSLDGSIELSSEYGSTHYDNLNGMENFAEAQGPDSEMVLVSVDGHILTAPISSLEQDAENVELGTPQFHLGPGESTEFVEGSEEFFVSEKVWGAGYLNSAETSSSSTKVGSVDAQPVDKNSSDLLESQANDIKDVKEVDLDVEILDKHHIASCSENVGRVQIDHEVGLLEDSHEVEGDAYESHETVAVVNEEKDTQIDVDVDEASLRINSRDMCSSSLQLLDSTKKAAEDDSDLEVQVESEDIHDKHTQSIQSSNDDLNEQSPETHTQDLESVSTHEDNVLDESGINEGSTPSCTISAAVIKEEQQQEVVMAAEATVSDLVPVDTDLEPKDEFSSYDASPSSPELDKSRAENSKSESLELQAPSPIEETRTDPSLRCEISLCSHLLRPGMGVAAAAEAFNAHRVSEEEYKRSTSSILKNENLVVRFRGSYLPWGKAAPVILGIAAFGSAFPLELNGTIPVEQEKIQKLEENDLGSPSTPGRRWRLWPIPFRRSKVLQHSNSNMSNDDVFVDTDSQSLTIDPPLTPQASTPRTEGGSKSPHKKILRTNIPTSEQIASLNLKDGQNMVTFSFSTRVLGLQQENGYQLLFLSARAIVQAYLTRSFLLNLKQDGKTLPNGPVVISPDGLLPSLFREVIRRAPHEFKIACLEDIKALFPPDYNPFYAGFGNRDTDELSYRKIGIPKGKIFIINPKGEVAINNRIDVKSYTSLHTLVNDMFPPTSLVEQEDYNSWNYWKMPVLEVDY